jgi:integrase
MQYTIQILIDRVTNKSASIRRPILIDSTNGEINELATSFIYRNYPKAALNTQIAVLRDIAFFFEWCELRRARHKNWLMPEARAIQGFTVLTEREVTDFARWCAVEAKQLLEARTLHPRIKILPAGKAVEGATHNRRITSAAQYCSWILKECTTLDSDQIDNFLKLDQSASKMKEAFKRHLQNLADSAKVRSLSEKEEAVLASALSLLPTNTAHARRDKLIVDLLYQSGLRSGELLKLRCIDINDNFKLEDGRITGCIEVHLIPNDPHDSRRSEPAAKTFPGLVPISRDLATRLSNYIYSDRQTAINRSGATITPYLFVCHSGKNIGEPMSQRNLNRLVAKMRIVQGVPSDFTPYVLRHTHLDGIYESATRKGKNAREILLQRGRWSHRSTMISRYAQRSITRLTAELVAERQARIDSAQ